MNSNRSLFRIGAVLALIGISACEEIEQVQDRFRDLTPHEAYQASLSDAGLTSTALGRDWILAGQQAVQAPVEISLPFREAGFITPEEPSAVGYRLTIGRGQRLTASVSLKSGEETRVFVDLFRMAENEDDPPRPILSTDSVPGTFEHEPWRGGDFLLRIQPELLRGGTYTVTLRLEAQLAFPVDGHGVRSIQSVFGANRDAGRRSHDGVDIFAPKGTPVLAISAGRVSRVQVTNLGGKVVWVRDPIRNSNLYYAHLDSQAVSRGQEVELGDTLGFVGNTGNARTTPPHLHFGIYRRGEGPVNPDPFLRPPRGALAEQTADLGHLGEWVRLLNDGIRLRATPERSGEILRELGQYTPLHVLGGSGEYFRVRLPDGAYGYVASHLTEPTDLPLGSEVAARNQMILSGPSYAASVIVQLDAGTEVPILGRYEGYLYVRTPSGQTGWMGEQQQ
ncbi:MAG: peptidoglycan DD-metalloendopeptidase family protein [Gemmatimonadetes bacterium]|nr:peptidoglycan DD-metalloendopeptidase family protein [Gemmatimonadota bacterium]